MKKNLYIAFLLISLISNKNAFAESHPQPLSADHRIKEVIYDPNNVVLLQSRYGYQTQIVFASDETVENVSLGDSLAWQVVPVANNLFIKPLASSKTNMTILTNAHSYSFQLDSSQSAISPTYKLQFLYQTTEDFKNNRTIKISLDPNKINQKYSFTGDRLLVPLTIFDNGQWTYFKFAKDGYHPIPAIFTVDKNRHEMLVNYHREGDYLVVNQVAYQFTLREGSYVTTIYNDFAIGDWKTLG